MRDSRRTAPRGKANRFPVAGNRVAAAEILPLPWPVAGISARAAHRPHHHRCITCSGEYPCAGPDETGECAPVCGPCLWVELGAQLKMYLSMAGAIGRRRRRIEEQYGVSLCRRQQNERRTLLRQRNVLAGFGRVVLQREDRELNINQGEEDSGLFRIDPPREEI